MANSFAEYERQLQAINQALNQTDDENEKIELEALKASILELLELTKQTEAIDGTNKLPDSEHDESQQDEMARFVAEIRAIDEESGVVENLDVDLDAKLAELKADLEKMVGKKCSAPHQHSWGAITFHNAIVCGVADDIEVGDDGELNAKLRVLFTNPTHREMLPCSYFLEGECRYDEERCHFSHGEVVPMSQLQEYMEPDFARLARNCVVLAKASNRLWHRGRVLCVNFVDKLCRVRLEGKEHRERETDYVFEDLLPIFHDEDLSSGSSDSSSDSDSEAELDDLEIARRAQLIQQSLFTFQPTQALGEWEKHTKGIGSKLMTKMGYIHGTGLGSDGLGIVTPITAQILPQGRSLDYCMELREAANGDKDLFSVERKLRHQKKKQDAINAKAYARESGRTDVFSFLNDNVFSSRNSNAIETKTSTSSSKKECNDLQQQTTKSLNIGSVRIADDIRRKQREIMQTQQSLERNTKNTEMQKRLQADLNQRRQELSALQNEEKNLSREQAKRKTTNKLCVF